VGDTIGPVAACDNHGHIAIGEGVKWWKTTILQQALAIAKFEPGMYEVVEIYSGTASEP